MSLVEEMDRRMPYPSSTLTHGHSSAAITFAALQQLESSPPVGVPGGNCLNYSEAFGSGNRRNYSRTCRVAFRVERHACASNGDIDRGHN